MSRRVLDTIYVLLALAAVVFMWRADRRMSAVRAAKPQPIVAAKPVTGTIANSVSPVGNRLAPVTMVFFTDYECPFCGRFASESMPELVRKYVDSGRLRVIVRHLPLSIHKNARYYALAAECAEQFPGDQLAFEMKLYDNKGLNPDSVVRAASEAKRLPADQISECIAANGMQRVVEEDVAAAEALRITGTPAFLIGKTSDSIRGRMIYGAYATASYASVVDSLLQHADR